MKRRITFLVLVLTMFFVPLAWGEAKVATIASAPGADGTWTATLKPYYSVGDGHMNVGVSGTTPGVSWEATVTLQRLFSGETVWRKVYEFTEDKQHGLFDSEPGVQYQIGIKQGDYTSGSIDVRISK